MFSSSTIKTSYEQRVTTEGSNIFLLPISYTKVPLIIVRKYVLESFIGEIIK